MNLQSELIDSLIEDYSEINDEYILHLISIWNEWTKKVVENNKLLTLPFSKHEINYLNSPLLDELKLCSERNSELILDIDDVFIIACRDCYFYILRWLGTELSDIGDRQRNLQWFCPHIHFETDYHLLLEYAFRVACGHGHLNVIKWLITTFPDLNHRSCKDCAYIWACENGHLDVKNWFQDYVREHNESPLEN